MDSGEASARKALQSWKEIAAYLGRSVRTVQRWERNFRLPVHRPKGQDRSAVLALSDELDHWLKATPTALEAESEAQHFSYRILVVDDEESIRTTAKQMLATEGYEVLTAVDGFDGLVHLQKAVPDIIISDLKMPNMSGFEFLSVVRRRFPHVGVIAITGEFLPVQEHAVLADVVLQKEDYSPKDLFMEILDLLERAPIRPRTKPTEKAAIWIPCSLDSYVVVTCPYCLRTFSIPQPEGSEVHSVHCPHCPQSVTFAITQRPAGDGVKQSGADSLKRPAGPVNEKASRVG